MNTRKLAASVAAAAVVALSVVACGSSGPSQAAPQIIKKQRIHHHNADGQWVIWYVLWLSNGTRVAVPPATYRAAATGGGYKSGRVYTPAEEDPTEGTRDEPEETGGTHVNQPPPEEEPPAEEPPAEEPPAEGGGDE